MANENMQLKQILTDNGYHWTRAREETFKLLSGGNPLSFNEILLQSKGKVDRVSIYRNIALFEKLGIAHRINFGWKYKIELSDQFVAHHHHLSCLSCGQIIDIEDEAHIDEFIATVAKDFDFTPKRHQFEIEGVCSECRSKPQPASAG